ncbi:MAG: hypothetical protein P8X42_14065 [Calditrichaceae bacterium]
MRLLNDYFSRLAICLLVIVIFNIANAQDRHFVLRNTHIIQMKSELTGRDHELIIFLPDSYADSTNKHYPVLYFMTS